MTKISTSFLRKNHHQGQHRRQLFLTMALSLALGWIGGLTFQSISGSHGVMTMMLMPQTEGRMLRTSSSSSEEATGAIPTTTTLAHCLTRRLPAWVHLGPQHFAELMWNASAGRTDKVGNPVHRKDRHSHQYQLLYWPYLSQLLARKQQCHLYQGQEEVEDDEDQTKKTNQDGAMMMMPANHALSPPQKLRFLEIGLGCNPQRQQVGGSALAWHALFRDLIPATELYIIEYDEGCAHEWHAQHPHIHVATGDASDPAALTRILQEELGNEPFDVIIDDGSHINQHQITALQTLFTDWIAPGGLYIIEDIESSCYNWPANVGKAQRGPGTGGTPHCLETTPDAHGQTNHTILGLLVEYQKQLLKWKRGHGPFGNTVTHIDIHWGGAVIQKKLEGF